MVDRASYISQYGQAPIPFGRTDGVLSRRLFAYLVDLVVITLLAALFGTLLAVASVITLGLTVPLFVFLWPATALLYSAVTVGGPARGTFGMRLTGVSAVDAETGHRVGFLIAAVHALMFYVGIGTMLLLFYNGVILGLVAVDYMLAGQTVFLLGWLLPHGVIEIPAVLIAGQGGLVLGRTLIG